MSVLYVRKQGDAQCLVDKGQTTFRRTFTVKCDIPNETKASILVCGLLPVYGSPYPEFFPAVCQSIDLKQNKDFPLFWTAACTWSTQQVDKKDPKDNQKQPDQRRPKWSCHFVAAPQYRVADMDGKPFQDSAGMPFDPPPSIPIYVDEFTISRYEDSFDRGFDRGFMNATNTDTWQGGQPGECLVADISMDGEEFIFGRYWFHYTYKVHVSPRILINGGAIGGFDPYYVLDAGTSYLDGAGKPTPIMQAGYLDGRPKKLDGHGHILAPGANPVYLKFRVANKKSFKDLGLVPPWQ